MPGPFTRRRGGAKLQLTIQVTADDIDGAVRGSPTRNPVAVAMMRQLNLAQVRVTRSAALLVWNSPDRKVEVVRLPFVARVFLVGFEGATRVWPCRFQLAVAPVDWRPLQTDLDTGLPQGAQAAARRIGDRANELLDRSREFPLGSRDRFVVKRVLEAYLPETLAGYLALNEAQRDRPISADGRTGCHVLMHELELIEMKVSEVGARLDRAEVRRSPANHLLLCELAAARGDTDAAQRHGAAIGRYRESLRPDDPGNDLFVASALARYAAAMRQINDRQEALRAGREAVALYRAHLGRIIVDRERERFAEAVLQVATDLEPPTAEAAIEVLPMALDASWQLALVERPAGIRAILKRQSVWLTALGLPGVARRVADLSRDPMVGIPRDRWFHELDEVRRLVEEVVPRA